MLDTASSSKELAIIDIGSSKIVCAIARISDDGSFILLSISHKNSVGLGFNGAISDLELLSKKIEETISEAENNARISVSKVIFNISGNNQLSLSQRISISIANESISYSDISYGIDLLINRNQSEKNTILQINPVFYSIDGGEYVDNPVMMSGGKLDILSNIIILPKVAVNNFSSLFSRSYVDIENIVSSAYVSGLAVLSSHEAEDGAMVMDIGDKNIAISCFINKRNIFTFSIPLGGYYITRDIADIFNIDKDCAEKIKILYGNIVDIHNIQGNAPINLLAISPEYKKYKDINISRNILNKIIFERINEIITITKKQIQNNPSFHNIYQQFVNHIIITGGTSNLIGIENVVRKIFSDKKHVRIGQVKQISLDHNLSNPIFATLTGLCLFASNVTKDNKINYHEGESSKNLFSLIRRRIANNPFVRFIKSNF